MFNILTLIIFSRFYKIVAPKKVITAEDWIIDVGGKIKALADETSRYGRFRIYDISRFVKPNQKKNKIVKHTHS